MEDSTLYVYKGDYENYLEKKAARMESDSASIEKARNTYRKELEWIRKQPKARTTKSKSRIDAFADVEAKAKKRVDEQQMELQMKMNRLGVRAGAGEQSSWHKNFIQSLASFIEMLSDCLHLLKQNMFVDIC